MFFYPGPGLWIDRTWLSTIEEPPEDFPHEFSLESIIFEPAPEVEMEETPFVRISDRDYFRRLLNLTDEEKESLKLAESEHTYNVRLIYFAGKRCASCTEKRSCTKHEDMMLLADEDYIWAEYSDR